MIIERRIPGKASGNAGSKPLTLEKQNTQQSQDAALGISKQASSPRNRAAAPVEPIAQHEQQQQPPRNNLSQNGDSHLTYGSAKSSASKGAVGGWAGGQE